MRKAFALLFIFVLMIISLTAYLVLTNNIMAGNLKIVTGEKQIEQGEVQLAQGKAKLAVGEQQLSQVKNMGKSMRALPVLGVVTWPVTAGMYLITKNSVADGDQQIARGELRIKAGEEQLEAGKMELQRGEARLSMANRVRIACEIATIFFACLFCLLGFCWKRKIK